MKGINQIKITRIATILQTVPGNNIINGESGMAFMRTKTLHDFGDELVRILEDEMTLDK